MVFFRDNKVETKATRRCMSLSLAGFVVILWLAIEWSGRQMKGTRHLKIVNSFTEKPRAFLSLKGNWLEQAGWFSCWYACGCDCAGGVFGDFAIGSNGSFARCKKTRE